MTRPARLVAAGAVTFGVGFSALAVLAHRAFWTGRFDVGNLAQAVWSTADGDFLSVTGLTGRQISRLGAHFDPLVAAFAPLWLLWPDPSLLLVSQAAAVATGAAPVYLLARRHLASEWAAGGFALAYLLHPATQWLVLDDFHPVALATPLLLWAFWFLDCDRLVPFAVVAGLACLTKEQIGLGRGCDGTLVRPTAGASAGRARGRRRRDDRLARRRARRRPALRSGWRLALRGPLHGGGRLARRHRRDGADRSGRDRRGREPGPRPRIPRRSAATASRTAAAGPPRGTHSAPGAGAEPPLRHPDPDLDPLPLHGRRAAGSHGRGSARRGTAAPPVLLGSPAGRARDRPVHAARGHRARAAAALGARSARLRGSRRATTSSGDVPPWRSAWCGSFPQVRP